MVAEARLFGKTHHFKMTSLKRNHIIRACYQHFFSVRTFDLRAIPLIIYISFEYHIKSSKARNQAHTTHDLCRINWYTSHTISSFIVLDKAILQQYHTDNKCCFRVLCFISLFYCDEIRAIHIVIIRSTLRHIPAPHTLITKSLQLEVVWFDWMSFIFMFR